MNWNATGGRAIRIASATHAAASTAIIEFALMLANRRFEFHKRVSFSSARTTNRCPSRCNLIALPYDARRPKSETVNPDHGTTPPRNCYDNSDSILFIFSDLCQRRTWWHATCMNRCCEHNQYNEQPVRIHLQSTGPVGRKRSGRSRDCSLRGLYSQCSLLDLPVC